MTFNDPSAGLTWFRGGRHLPRSAAALRDLLRQQRARGDDLRELARFILGENAMPWWWMYEFEN